MLKKSWKLRFLADAQKAKNLKDIMELGATSNGPDQKVLEAAQNTCADAIQEMERSFSEFDQCASTVLALHSKDENRRFERVERPLQHDERKRFDSVNVIDTTCEKEMEIVKVKESESSCSPVRLQLEDLATRPTPEAQGTVNPPPSPTTPHRGSDGPIQRSRAPQSRRRVRRAGAPEFRKSKKTSAPWSSPLRKYSVQTRAEEVTSKGGYSTPRQLQLNETLASGRGPYSCISSSRGLLVEDILDSRYAEVQACSISQKKKQRTNHLFPGRHRHSSPVMVARSRESGTGDEDDDDDDDDDNGDDGCDIDEGNDLLASLMLSGGHFYAMKEYERSVQRYNENKGTPVSSPLSRRRWRRGNRTHLQPSPRPQQPGLIECARSTVPYAQRASFVGELGKLDGNNDHVFSNFVTDANEAPTKEQNTGAGKNFTRREPHIESPPLRDQQLQIIHSENVSISTRLHNYVTEGAEMSRPDLTQRLRQSLTLRELELSMQSGDKCVNESESRQADGSVVVADIIPSSIEQDGDDDIESGEGNCDGDTSLVLPDERRNASTVVVPMNISSKESIPFENDECRSPRRASHMKKQKDSDCNSGTEKTKFLSIKIPSMSPDPLSVMFRSISTTELESLLPATTNNGELKKMVSRNPLLS